SRPRRPRQVSGTGRARGGRGASGIANVQGGRRGADRWRMTPGPRAISSLRVAPAPPSVWLRQLGFLRVDDERRLVLDDDVLADDDLLDPRPRGHVVHDVEHRRLEDGAEAAGAARALERLPRDRDEGAAGELELHPVHLEELLVLAHQAVL